ncbi:MAG: hypothetical protein IPP55_14315 [Anaerolineales bacterium]|jgi:hypothetical protein|nr:hypothetical protein [Anaerolineales bacterium]
MVKKKGNSSWLAMIAVLVIAAFAWYAFSKGNASSENIEESGSEGATEFVTTLQTSTPVEEPIATPTMSIPTKVKSLEELSLEIAPVYKDEATGIAYDRYYLDGYVWFVDSNNIAVKVWNPENNEDSSFEKTGKQGFRLIDGSFVTMEYSKSIDIPKGGEDVKGKPSFTSWEDASQYIVNVRNAQFTSNFFENQLDSPSTSESANSKYSLLRSIAAKAGNNMHKSFREGFVKTIDGEEVYVRAIIFPDFLVVAFAVEDENGDWSFDLLTIAMNEAEFNAKYDCVAGQNGNMTIWKQMTLPSRLVPLENN